MLHVKGVLYDKIVTLHGLYIKRASDTINLKILNLIAQDAYRLVQDSKFYQGVQWIEVFWRIILGDRTEAGAKPSPEYLQDFYNWKDREGAKPPSASFLQRFLSTWICTYLVGTEPGLVGFSNLATRTGDVISILPGCSVPLLLRKTKSRNGTNWRVL